MPESRWTPRISLSGVECAFFLKGWWYGPFPRTVTVAPPPLLRMCHWVPHTIFYVMQHRGAEVTVVGWRSPTEQTGNKGPERVRTTRDLGGAG